MRHAGARCFKSRPRRDGDAVLRTRVSSSRTTGNGATGTSNHSSFWAGGVVVSHEQHSHLNAPYRAFAHLSGTIPGSMLARGRFLLMLARGRLLVVLGRGTSW